jgi:hypothetical protein
VTHGQYAPANPGPKYIKEYDGSVMFGHTHRVSVFIEGKRGAYNIGGLFDKHAFGMHYAPRHKREKQTNGFAVIDTDDRGRFWVQMVQAWDGYFTCDGVGY